MDRQHRFSRFHRALILGSVAALALVLPASAGGATVTRGAFHEFTGVTMDIGGQAVMVRTADGRTIVTVHVDGLTAGDVYGSHVHALPCDTSSAGGHYKFDPAGAGAPPNEIWPGPFTANDGGVGNGNTIAHGTAGSTAQSVVIHSSTGAKIACADLE